MKKIDDIYIEKLNEVLDCELQDNNINFKKSPFILFGAGNLGVRTVLGLKKVGIYPIAFADNNEEKWGNNIEGLNVFSKENIMRQYGENILIVVTVWGASLGKEARVATIMKKLKEYGFKNVVDITKLYNNYPEVFLPHYCIDLPNKIQKDREKILACYNLLEDNKSKNEYYEQVRWRLKHDNWGKFTDVDCTPYFQNDIYELNENDIIYDCGAFDGDTVRSLLDGDRDFKKIISFEPDKENFNKLTSFVERQCYEIKSKIRTYEYAVGNKEELLSFKSSADASSTISDNGACEVKSIRIDKMVEEGWDDIPTIIKMDIEGFEENAIYGAINVIKKYKPILLISVYHKQRDLWEIPLLINKISEGYKFYLRHHTGDCWDTVLYAIPSNRYVINKEK